jgi:hypothetical protein
MQTFLPYPSFEQSMRVLDKRRLGKQRVEAYQILRTLSGISVGWRNHPAVRMWAGYEAALSLYLRTAIQEWIHRGCRNNMIIPSNPDKYILPHWFGSEQFHSAHRSNLLRKDLAWYSQFNWIESPDIPYFWPV